MDRAEATQILREHLDRLEGEGHAALSNRIGNDEVVSARGMSGTEYQLELTVLWDLNPGGDVRIVGSIDDGGPRARIRASCPSDPSAEAGDAMSRRPFA